MTDADLKAELRAAQEQIKAVDRRITELRQVDQDAIRAAVETLKERLGLLNELRQVVVDQARDFARSAEVEQKFETLKKDVEDVEKIVEALRTVQSTRDVSSVTARVLFFAISGLIISLLLLALAFWPSP